jgi:hypothetical protein
VGPGIWVFAYKGLVEDLGYIGCDTVIPTVIRGSLTCHRNFTVTVILEKAIAEIECAAIRSVAVDCYLGLVRSVLNNGGHAPPICSRRNRL